MYGNRHIRVMGGRYFLDYLLVILGIKAVELCVSLLASLSDSSDTLDISLGSFFVTSLHLHVNASHKSFMLCNSCVACYFLQLQYRTNVLNACTSRPAKMMFMRIN